MRVPLIILGFITSAIVSLKKVPEKILSVTLLIYYISSVGAALFSMIAGYSIIPGLDIVSKVGKGVALPETPLKLTVQPIMPVMTALVTSICIGIFVIKTGAKTWENLVNEFQKIVLMIVEKVIITILPLYIATTLLH